MKKRILFIISTLMVLSMLIAACAPAAAECTDSIGCVDVKAGDPVHIAYAMVTSGADATLGIDSRNGAEIAVDDKGGKVLGHDIKFDGEDELCSAEGGQAAGTKLAADPTVVAVIGTSCSSAARVGHAIVVHGWLYCHFSFQHCPRPDHGRQ